MQFALARHARRLIIKDSTVSAFLDHFQQKLHFHLFYIIIPILRIFILRSRNNYRYVDTCLYFYRTFLPVRFSNSQIFLIVNFNRQTAKDAARIKCCNNKASNCFVI